MKQVDLKIRGGSKGLKELVKATVQISKRVLMPRIGDLEVEVKITNNLGYAGLCTMFSEKEMLIEIEECDCMEEFIKTVIHEMVHVKQYARRELKQVHPDFYLWRGELVAVNVGYINYPWEHEADKLEELIFNELWGKK